MRYIGAVRLNGILAPICTPFASDGELHLQALRQNIRKYNAAGLLGYVVAGSTGEAAYLSREERLTLFESVRDDANGKLLVAGTGLESVRETVRLTNAAAEIGYDAALVLTPHYYRGQMLRPEAQVSFYRAVADAAKIPVVIYNIAQVTGIDLPLDVVLQLSAHPNIIGMKESSADLERVGNILAGLPRTFPVLVGSSAKFHEGLCLGAAGGILAIANALPQPAQEIYDRYSAGDVQGSCAAQHRIVDVAGVAPRFGIQGLKYAMDLLGYYGGPARLPLLPPDAQQKSEIERLARPFIER